MIKCVNIFEFTNFAEYLKTWRQKAKEYNPGLSHEYLCSKLGRKGKTFFGDLEQGRKLPGPVTVDKLITLMTLTGDEAKYFRAMVGYNHSTTYAEREYWFEQMVELNHTPKKVIQKEAYTFYKEWYHTTIRAYLDIINFKGEYTKAAKALYNRVTAEQVKKSIALLSKLGLIQKNERGYWKPTEAIVSTGELTTDEVIKRYQVENHRILGTILEEEDPNCKTTQLTLSLSALGAERALKRLDQCKRELLAIANKDELHAERVYKVTINIYPETRKVPS